MSREIPELDKKGLRNFAWMFAAVVVSLFGLTLPWLLNRNWPWEPWAIAIIFFSWGLVAPNSLRPFYRLWIRFGFVMNFIMSRVVLAFVFYVLIFPYGLMFRLGGKDPMRRKIESESSSYRIESHKTSAKHMERPF